VTGLLVTLIWFPLLGAALSRLTGRMSWFLAGAGVNGLALSIAGVFHLPLKWTLLLLGFAAIVILSAAKDPRRQPATDPSPSPRTLWALSAILLIGAILTPLTDYDGRAFWLLKAKAIAHEQRIDGPFFQLQSTYSPRNAYPLLVPIDAATVMMFSGDLDDRHTRALFAMFAIALAFEASRRFRWLGLLVLLLPQIVGASGGARSAGCDVPLAAFAACALFELVEAKSPLRFGLWLSFLALTKNEGLPFALILLVAGVFVFRKKILVSAAPFAIAFATLFAWRAGIPATDENEFIAQLPRLPERLPLLGDAVREFFPWFVRFEDWGVLWIVVAAAIVWLAVRRKWRPLAIGLVALLPMLLFYLVAYVISDWSVADLVRVTAARLISHLLGPALVLIGAMTQSSQ